MAKLALRIGQAMGLTVDQLECLRIASLLHDFGELTVARRILCSPGKLSRQEFAIVRTHCRRGWDLIKHLPYPRAVALVVLQHHERLDGSGYPDGLKGDAICREARIVAVADVAEAMTAARSYRPPLGVDAALEQLWRSRSVRYDGDVVSACSDLLRDPDFLRSWHDIPSVFAPQQ